MKSILLIGASMLYTPLTPQMGEPYHAALITHVWGPDMVNLIVFPPSGSPYSATSVKVAIPAGAIPNTACAVVEPIMYDRQNPDELGAVNNLTEAIDRLNMTISSLKESIDTAPVEDAPLPLEQPINNDAVPAGSMVFTPGSEAAPVVSEQLPQAVKLMTHPVAHHLR